MMDFFGERDTFIVTLVGVVVVLWVLVSVLLKVWPFLSKLVTMVNGFVGHGHEPGLIDRVKVLEENSTDEQNNHHKMSSQLDRVETNVQLLSRRFDEFSAGSTQDRQRLWDIARHHHGENIPGNEEE